MKISTRLANVEGVGSADEAKQELPCSHPAISTAWLGVGLFGLDRICWFAEVALSCAIRPDGVWFKERVLKLSWVPHNCVFGS